MEAPGRQPLPGGLGLVDGDRRRGGRLGVVVSGGLLAHHPAQLGFNGGGHFSTGAPADARHCFLNPSIGMDDKL